MEQSLQSFCNKVVHLSCQKKTAHFFGPTKAAGALLRFANTAASATVSAQCHIIWPAPPTFQHPPAGSVFPPWGKVYCHHSSLSTLLSFVYARRGWWEPITWQTWIQFVLINLSHVSWTLMHDYRSSKFLAWERIFANSVGTGFLCETFLTSLILQYYFAVQGVNKLCSHLKYEQVKQAAAEVTVVHEIKVTLR